MHGQLRLAHLDIFSSNILVNHIAHRPTRGQPFLHTFDFRMAFIDYEFATWLPSKGEKHGAGGAMVDPRRLSPTYQNFLPEVVQGRQSYVDGFAADVSIRSTSQWII